MRRFRLPSPATRVVAALLAAFLVAATPVHAQVLNQVPANALVVVKFRDLQDVSTKVAKLADQLGISGMVPEFADPLGALQTKTGVQNGLKKEGELAIVFVDPATVGGDNDKAFFILIPVSDYKAFIGNFEGAQADGAVTQVQLAHAGEPAFAAQWGDYAALGSSKELIAKPPTDRLKVAGLSAKQLASKDAVVYANFPALRPKLLPELDKGRQKMVADIERELAAKPETQKYIPIAKALANQLLDMAEQFIKETDAATFAVNLNDQGIATSLMAEFQPTSSLGLKVAQLKGTEQPLLNGLPDEKYLFVGGYAVDPKVAGKIAADLLDPIVKELATLGEDAAPFQAMADAIKQQIAATSSASMGMVAPEGMLGQASLVQVVGVLRGDAKAIRDASRKQFQSQEQVMNMFAGQAGQMTTTYTANAKTVDGIALDQFKSQLNLDPQTPEAAQAQQALTMMYGPNGMTGYVGVLDDKTLISAAGVSDELLAGALTAAKAGNDTVGARQNIKAVAAQLPANRLAVWYIPLDVLVSTGLNYARQMGMQMQLQLPPDQPPIGMAVATQGNALGVESFIPAELVQNLVAAGMQIMMQMKGGGGAGGPGGL